MKFKLFLFIFFLCGSLLANEISGIPKIIDGDSIKIKQQNIRLIFIDAPELKQYCENSKEKLYSCGFSAKKNLLKMIDNKNLNCKYFSKDKYNRILAECFLPEKKDSINYQMVKNGWAIVYRRYSFPNNFDLAENYAKKFKLGIWQGKFITPELWRRKNK
tara:strand:+ start:885 stop:1364 length:480 start_codon:yes stop_codon:yes gene_type:complete